MAQSLQVGHSHDMESVLMFRNMFSGSTDGAQQTVVRCTRTDGKPAGINARLGG